MKNWKKILLGLFVTLLVIFIVSGLIFRYMLSKSLPEYSGEISSDRIKETVEIFRDSMAIPYIFSNNDEDAAFALGFVHAQERMFIMDLIRRAGEGRLSEIFGEKTLPFDRMFRTIGIGRTIKHNIRLYDPEVMKILQGYANGVNLYLKNYEGKLPVEFDVLGYEPENWKPEHSLIVIRMMGWELNLSWWIDMTYSELFDKFGKEKMLEILPDISDKIELPKKNGITSLNNFPDEFLKTNLAFREFMGWRGTQVGSNNWVINGNKSKSGKPIIANDPHLAFSAPGKWYVAVIKSPNWNAAGVTLPGVPGVVIGKNENISWALTNLMNDDADFYYEKLDTSRTKYFVDGNWKNLEIIKDTIKIKNQKEVVIEIKNTHRGPIISSIHPSNFIYNSDEKNYPDISVRWLGNEFSDEMHAFLSMNKAKNFNEFKEAISYFSLPGQNFVYADNDGNIGYVMGGNIPLRSLSSSTIISDGTNSKNDWMGILGKSEMAYIYNPPENFIATANNKVVDDFKYHISNLWEPSARIERIRELLNSKTKHDVNDYFNYQLDFVSNYAKQVVPYILNAFSDVKITDKNLIEALELFTEWDGTMDPDLQIPSIYESFFKHLLKNVYYDEMGEDLFNKFCFIANVPLRSVLKALDSNSSWFNNIKTSKLENRDEIIRRSLADALSELEGNYGKDIINWQWGNIHKVTFKHPFSGTVSLIDKFINIGPFRIGGNGTTIFNTQHSFAKSLEEYPAFRHEEYENILGPSMRYIYDFSQPDKFFITLTTGQSGNFFSDHYSDMSYSWLNGKYFQITTDETSIRTQEKYLLTIRQQ